MASKAGPKPQPRGGKKKNRRAHRNIQTRSSSPGSASSKKRPKGKSALLGKTIKLEITDMAQGGFAMGRHRGKAVFVPYTLPGESISAEIYQDRGSAIFARGKDLYAASADRVSARCAHFGPGRCWACQFQHIDYQAQLLLKQDVLADQLARVGKLPDSLIDSVMRPLAPASEQWGYNHRLSLSRAAAGGWGLPRQAKGGIEALAECHTAHPDLIDTLGKLDVDYEQARRLVLQRGSDGRIMVIFHVDEEVAPALHTDLPLSVNLLLPDNSPINLIGAPYSTVSVADRAIRITAGSSMRPNINQIGPLAEEVMRALELGGGEKALDLYAGAGFFSAVMAERAELITLVESYPPAANDAEFNLRQFDHIDIVEGQVEAVLGDMTAESARYDVALVDPPGSGINGGIVDSLLGLGVRHLVYVSGDPASLARDCRRLIDTGFQLKSLQAVDMAPQTFYITAVAAFER
ncbi:MAG: hypothetical protein OXN94_13030 [Chloroflexota bacterium]|nr:hypothetical protein [Chloroflexota bacterium]